MSKNAAFVGSVPANYHRYLGPLIFEDYAADLTHRLAVRPGERVLELACGTGIVTRRIASALPKDATIMATDLNEAMLAVARETVGAIPRVIFQQADACAIPFPDASFDALACQYGVMFFPDKVGAMREARRVLRAGGRYVFNVWDSLEHNPIARIVHETAAAAFPENPPSFLARAPYAWFNISEIERIVRAGGFTRFEAETVDLPCIAPTADDAARGFVDGTPLFGELKERGVTDTTSIRQAAAQGLAARFGEKPCRATMRAVVVVAS